MREKFQNLSHINHPARRRIQGGTTAVVRVPSSNLALRGSLVDEDGTKLTNSSPIWFKPVSHWMRHVLLPCAPSLRQLNTHRFAQGPSAQRLEHCHASNDYWDVRSRLGGGADAGRWPPAGSHVTSCRPRSLTQNCRTYEHSTRTGSLAAPGLPLGASDLLSQRCSLTCSRTLDPRGSASSSPR